MKRDIFIFGEDGEIDGVVCIFFLIVKVFSELFVDDNIDCLIINWKRELCIRNVF